jgi:hypothetical protein
MDDRFVANGQSLSRGGKPQLKMYRVKGLIKKKLMLNLIFGGYIYVLPG